MNANELRIGNYTSLGSVIHIGLGRFAVLGDGDYFDSLDAEIEPIPLTEEWLMKFGFKKDNPNYSWYRLDSVIINIFNGRAYKLNINSSNPYRHFYYVHQLQNLYFALTGEELKLKQDEH